MDVCAPMRVTEIAAALEASLTASTIDISLATQAARTPQNVSPAAVLSTALTSSAGI